MIDSKYIRRVLPLLVFMPMVATAQMEVPLKNWKAPQYFQPSQIERENISKSGAEIQFSANATSNTALVFVAVSPCRLVDTRGASAGFIGSTPFNGPYIPAGGTATFPVQSSTETQTTAPSPCGTIPSIAQAYSLNLTVVPHPFGTPVNYVTMWPTGVTIPQVSTLNDQQGVVAANAAIVPAGSSSGGINVFAYGAADVIIDMNGFYAAPTDLNSNTAIGAGTLVSLASGGVGFNTAVGDDALNANTTGYENVATGASALRDNTTGFGDTAGGTSALFSNTTGSYNTATGAEALYSNINGGYNTGDGVEALYANTSGSNNTAYGAEALVGNSSGSGNIAIGYQAAVNVSGGNSNNIHIGNQGVSTDNGVIWIGTQGTQTVTKIAGIYGQLISTPNYQVCIDATARLGAGSSCSGTPSSRRFKDQITDMGNKSNKLLQLRPVTFFYKPEYDDGSHLLQYGLVAEEVAKIYPDMVGYDEEGQPNSVKYQSLTPMLLNEVQQQNAHIRSLEEAVQRQQEENRKLEDGSRKLEERLAALEAQLSEPISAGARTGGTQ